MKSTVTNTFGKQLRQLPKSVQQQAAKVLRSGEKISITTVYNLKESVNVNQFILLVLAVTIVC